MISLFAVAGSAQKRSRYIEQDNTARTERPRIFDGTSNTAGINVAGGDWANDTNAAAAATSRPTATGRVRRDVIETASFGEPGMSKVTFTPAEPVLSAPVRPDIERSLPPTLKKVNRPRQ